MCLFHKWEKIEEYNGTASQKYFMPLLKEVRTETQDIIGVIKKCSKCGKEKGYIEYPDGERMVQAPWHIRRNVGKNV